MLTIHVTSLFEYLPWLSWLHKLQWLLWLNSGSNYENTVVEVRVQLSHENGVVTMVTKLNHFWYHVMHPSLEFESPPYWDGWSYRVRNYAAEVTFSGMAPCLISWPSTNWFRVFSGRHRRTYKTAWWSHKLQYLFSRKRGFILLAFTILLFLEQRFRALKCRMTVCVCVCARARENVDHIEVFIWTAPCSSVKVKF
jgi:hypothetical protein